MYLFDSGQALFPSDLFPPSGTWFLKSNVSDHCSELISSRSHYRFACPLKCSSQRCSGLHFLSFILTFAAAQILTNHNSFQAQDSQGQFWMTSFAEGVSVLQGVLDTVVGDLLSSFPSAPSGTLRFCNARYI